MSLDQFFTPRSVAIVGASRKIGKVGYEILAGLQKAGFEGDIYPVNPTADEIMGLRSYPDLKAIGSTPDLVVIVVAAKHAIKVMQDCADIGTKSVIVVASGFKEAGPDGTELEKKACSDRQKRQHPYHRPQLYRG